MQTHTHPPYTQTDIQGLGRDELGFDFFLQRSILRP